MQIYKVPLVNQENNVYYTITPESIVREHERLHEKVQHDEAQALHHAEQKGMAEGSVEKSDMEEVGRLHANI